MKVRHGGASGLEGPFRAHKVRAAAEGQLLKNLTGSVAKYLYLTPQHRTFRRINKVTMYPASYGDRRQKYLFTC